MMWILPFANRIRLWLGILYFRRTHDLDMALPTGKYISSRFYDAFDGVESQEERKAEGNVLIFADWSVLIGRVLHCANT